MLVHKGWLWIQILLCQMLCQKKRKKKSRISASESSHTGMSLWRNMETRPYIGQHDRWRVLHPHSLSITFLVLQERRLSKKWKSQVYFIFLLPCGRPIEISVLYHLSRLTGMVLVTFNISEHLADTRGIRDMLEIVLQPHHIWVWLPLTKLGNFADIFLISSQWHILKSTETEPGFVHRQWKHTHTHRLKALGNFPESQKADIYLAIFLSWNASLIL